MGSFNDKYLSLLGYCAQAGSIPYGEIFGEHFGFVTIEEYLLYMDKLNDHWLQIITIQQL